jgi:hypothetical protein
VALVRALVAQGRRVAVMETGRRRHGEDAEGSSTTMRSNC